MSKNISPNSSIVFQFPLLQDAFDLEAETSVIRQVAIKLEGFAYFRVHKLFHDSFAKWYIYESKVATQITCGREKHERLIDIEREHEKFDKQFDTELDAVWQQIRNSVLEVLDGLKPLAPTSLEITEHSKLRSLLLANEFRLSHDKFEPLQESSTWFRVFVQTSITNMSSKSRLEVDSIGERIRIDDEWFFFRGPEHMKTNLCNFYQTMVERRDYVSMTSFKIRTRDIERQPPPIRDLLDSQPAAGTRIHPQWFN